MATVPVEVCAVIATCCYLWPHTDHCSWSLPHMLYTTGHAGPREVAATYQTQDVFKSVKDGVFVKQHWSRQTCCLSFTLFSSQTHPPPNGGCSRSTLQLLEVSPCLAPSTIWWGHCFPGQYHVFTLFSVPSCVWVWLVLRVTLELQLQHTKIIHTMYP